MKLTILTPNKQIFEGHITSVTIPGSAGAFQILANHAPIISSLEPGKITYVNEGEKNELMIQQGIVSAHDNQVTILVEI
ncbi:MAG: ATP synthase F1 subunit epsilon [Candidatus Amoebophilus sp. 36-38]|nr:MAG: ATP synthase F1 subunit epsilon [Candidatus Amoebophilus sp. 36-38]